MKAGWLPSWKAVAGSTRMSLRHFAQPKKPQAGLAGETVIAAPICRCSSVSGACRGRCGPVGARFGGGW